MECSWVEQEDGVINIRPVKILQKDDQTQTERLQQAYTLASTYIFS